MDKPLRDLRTSTALRTLPFALCLLSVIGTTALADGGSGGTITESNGGLDSVTGAGGAGGEGFANQQETFGGGGGGAGVVGGDGGRGGTFSDDGIGGTGALSAGGDGTQGGFGNGTFGNGGGGGGGAHAYTGMALPAGPLLGGKGGAGGDCNYNCLAGGGGAGGYGAVVTGTIAAGTISATITGGAGGAGGNAPIFNGGSGGSGGQGLHVIGSGSRFTVTGAVAGGAGGAAGQSWTASFRNGAPGPGGIGIVGTDLSIVNRGSISGGLSGNGGTRAHALALFGSNNRYEIWAGSTTLGNVEVEGGTFALGGTSDGDFDASAIGTQFAGFTAFEKTGSGTWTLSGAGAQNWSILEGGLSGSASSMAGDLTFGTGPASRSVIFTETASGSYSGTISGEGDLIKRGAGTLTLTGSNTFSGSTTIDAGTLVVGSSAALGDGSATNTLVFGGGSLRATGDISSPSSRGVELSGAATIDTNGNNVSIAGSVAGTGSLTKSGGGTLTLSGSNSYTGATSVTAGVLNIGSATALGTTAGGTIVASGAALEIQGGIGVGAEALSLSGVGIASGGALRNLSGSNSLAGAITLGSATRINSDTGTLALSGGISGSGNSLTVGGAGNVTLNGALNIGAGTLTKDGGGTLVLNGTSSHTGGTTVTAGVLNVRNGLALGGTGSGTLVASGAALEIQGGIGVGTEALTLSGAGVANDGALRNVSGNNSLTGAITLGSAARINSDTGTLALSGGISGSGNSLTVGGAGNVTLTGGLNIGAGTLIKDGGGTLVLNGTSSHTGGTTVTAGVLNVRNGLALGITAGGTSIASGAALEIQDTIAVGGEPLSLSGTGVSNGGALRNVSGNNSLAGAITLAADTRIASDTGTLTLYGGITGANSASPAALTVGGAGNIEIAGIVGANLTGLAKTGAGTLTLSAANTYGGATTITGGTLALTGTGSIASSASMQLTAGTLDISGTSSGATINALSGANGTLALGSKTLTLNHISAGLFAGSITGSGTLVKSGTGEFQFVGDGSAHTGTVNVNAGTLNLNNAGGTTAGRLGGSVSIASGATLTASGGTIDGTVTVAAGGTLDRAVEPDAQGLAMGTLVMDAGAIMTVNLATPGTGVAAFSTVGNTTVNGSLTLTGAPGYGVGVYRIVSAGGTVTDNGLTLGTTSIGTLVNVLEIGTSTVDLQVKAADTSLQYWSADGVSRGGGGNWTAANPWLNAGGGIAAWDSQTAVFDGPVGLVAVEGIQSFGTIEFLASGYEIQAGVGGGLDLGTGGRLWAEGENTVATVSAPISGTGALTKIGAGTVVLSGANSYQGGTVLQAGTLRVSQDVNLGDASGALTFTGGKLETTASFASARSVVLTSAAMINVGDGTTLTLSGNVSGAGALTLGSGTLVLSGANTYQGGTAIHGSTLQISSDANLGAAGGGLTFQGGTLSTTASLDSARNVLLRPPGTAQGGAPIPGGGTFDVAAGTVLGLSGTIGGAGGLTKTGAGRQILTGANSYTGGTTILAGTLQIGAGGTSGSIVGNVANAGTLVFDRADAVSFGGAVSGSGVLRQAGTGTTVLTGISSYTGATFVDAGTLVVNGSIAASSGVTVAAGAALGGAGALPSLTMNGTLSPGNSPGTLTINGNLTLGAGATYIAEVQGGLSDRVAVTGTASLAGTLSVVPLGGAYLFSAPYTLLSAAGGRSGSFGFVDTNGSFGDGVTSSVSYTATDVQLTLTPKPLAPIVDPVVDPIVDPVQPPFVPPTPAPARILGVGRPANAYAVASAIDAAVARGADPSGLFAIYNLPAAAIPGAVNQLSGEVHASAPAIAGSASGQFLRTMLDGSGAGRLASAPGGPAGSAGFTAALPSRQDGPGWASFDPARFSLWGATFGSAGRSDGNRFDGSANRNLSDAHAAVGADIRLGDATVIGAAVAGGQSRASLSGGLGKADADVFQAGLYGRTLIGPLNLSAALAYARLDIETSRAVPALLRSGITASYVTEAWSGRIEASLPVARWGGLTISPLAAFQAVRSASPAAIERDQVGVGIGTLALARRSDTTSRSELGLQIDANLVTGATPVTGFLRAAWAHYYQRDAALTASLNGLAGASFIATGARPDRNAALLSAGADIRFSPSVSLGLRLDSELGADTRRLGGTAQLRVSF